MPSFDHDLLRTVRLDLGLTQEQAALALGIDVRTYRRYESGAVNAGGEFSVRQPGRRKLLRRMCEQFGVADERAWLKPARTEPEAAISDTDNDAWAPRVVHPLQPALHFTGRADVLEQLAHWYASDESTNRVLALVAAGGAGKTATVEQFLARHQGQGPWRGGVFVWSFYEDSRVEAMLGDALAYFGRGEAGAEGGRLERLLDALSSGPRHLLVLDGLETAQSNGADGRAFGELAHPLLRRLLRALAAGAGDARAVVTSRSPLVDVSAWQGRGARTVLLGDLSADEARAVLRAWGLRGDDAALESALTRVGRHALAVATAGSYAGAFLGGDPARLDALDVRAAASDDPLARRLHGVLAAYAQALPPLERDMLARLAAFGHAVPAPLLARVAESGDVVAGALAGCTETDLLRALGRLVRRGLAYRAEREPPAFAAHPFVREHFRGLLGVAPEALHTVARDALAPTLAGLPRGVGATPELLDRYEQLLEHTLRAGDARRAWELYEDALGGFANLGLRLGAMSRGLRVTSWFARRDAPDGVHPDLPWRPRAEALYDRGLYAGALGDLGLSRRCYEACLRALANGPVGGTAAWRATAHRTLGYTRWLAGELGAAASALRDSLAIAHAEAPQHVVRGLALLATVEHDRGEVARGEQLRAEARALEPGALTPRRALWEAEAHLTLGRNEAAQALAESVLALSATRAWAGHVAHARVVLGESRAERDPVFARSACLEPAREWVRASGEVEAALRCHQLAARLALLAGRWDDALAEAQAGLEPAALHGYGLFATRLELLAAAALRAGGRAREASDAAERARARASACGYAWGEADALHEAGLSARALGLEAEARAVLARALALRARLDHPGEEATRAALG